MNNSSKLFKSLYSFLAELDQNNNREWFAENKTRYQELHAGLIDWIAELQSYLAQFDEKMLDIVPKNALFRIYKDARFAKGKAPYKTHFGIHLVTSGSRSDFTRAGYYIHIEPGASFIAGGAHAPSPEWLKAIRANWAQDGDEFLRILKSSSFKKEFQIEGSTLTRPPKGYLQDEPYIELLKYKTIVARHQLNDKIVTGPNFTGECIKLFQVYKPFRDFLNRPNPNL